ncbi:UNVERIFIED_CONTAM: hypothetical protein Sindi_2406800 [Sesamum indicum]
MLEPVDLEKDKRSTIKDEKLSVNQRLSKFRNMIRNMEKNDNSEQVKGLQGKVAVHLHNGWGNKWSTRVFTGGLSV